MDNRLIKFLTKREVRKREPFTHTSKIKPMRTYYLEGDDLEEFYKIYNTVIADGGISGITEKPESIVPLIVDIDFRCNLDKGLVRYYKPKHIKAIVKIYQEIIAELVKKPADKHFICCVLEKLEPVNFQGKCKDGFHLHFPNFLTEHWIQTDVIRPRVIQRVQKDKIFADIPMLESLDKVFDKNIPKNCWLMYGSRKDLKAEAYKLTKRYNKDMELLPLNSVFKTKYPTGNRKWNLPRYLSIRQNANPTKLIKDIIVKKPVPKIKRKKEFQREAEDIKKDLEKADLFLGILDKERADDYMQWMEIGWILFNISEGMQEGLDRWISFSAHSEKFQDGICEQEWSKMEVRNYSLGSLKYLAKTDSPQEYKGLCDQEINALLDHGISMAHNDIAKILYIMFENKYICADVEKAIWYEFKGHRWVRNPTGINLRKELSTNLVNKYFEMMRNYLQRAQDMEDEMQKQMYNTKVGLIVKLVEKLKNNTFKNAVLKECMEFFYDPDFVEKMDENPHLLVCENGVYDAETRIFRDGRPDDYCTKSTGIYYHEFEENDPRVIELQEIFRKTFVKDNLFKFFKQTASDLIRGGNRHKIFVIWTGAGDNGKSICSDLLERAFGDYFYTPPTSILTGKQQSSSGATAELLPCKGARVIVVSETDNADVLNCGVMKKLTGGDPFYARGLFKEPIKIVPQFKLVLHCNKMPNVSAEDKASWNRIRVLPYDSTFVKAEKAPETLEEQYIKKVFPMDKTLKERLTDLSEAFLWWLIKEYESFGDADLFEPLDVQAATEAYHRTNDHYMQFVDERMQETKNKKDFITLTVAYALFKVWYKDSFPGRTIPTRIQVKEALEKKLGTQIKGVWRGIRTFDPDEELENEENEENEDEEKYMEDNDADEADEEDEEKYMEDNDVDKADEEDE